MKTKILLQVTQGIITGIFSTSEIEVCIVDFDNIQNGSSPINETEPIQKQDLIFKSSKAYKIYNNEKDPEEMEAREELKKLKF